MKQYEDIMAIKHNDMKNDAPFLHKIELIKSNENEIGVTKATEAENQNQRDRSQYTEIIVIEADAVKIDAIEINAIEEDETEADATEIDATGTNATKIDAAK